MRADDEDRLQRLELLTSRLAADEPLTVGELAAEFGVSMRTLARDIERLRRRGVPVEADRGRGGGIRLSRRWGVGRLSLTHREAVDLLVSLAIAEQLKSPWALASLRSIRHKLVASLPPGLRDNIASLRRRILIGATASPQVLATPAAPNGDGTAQLFDSFVERRLLRFSYTGGTGRQSQRLIEPQLLLLNAPVWYVVGWDRNREAARTFRVDRMRRAQMEDEAFALRPASSFADAIAGVEAITP